MKLLYKLPKSNPNLHLDLIKNGWIPMKEPKNLISAILLSIPLMIVASMISIGVINIFSSISWRDFGFTSGGISININLSVILGIVGLTLFGAFVMTEEKISKPRYMFITIAPFTIILVIFPLILSICGLLTATIKFLIILNSMGSSVDLLNVLLIMKQVPKNATLTSNGANTYWKNAQAEQEG